MSNDKTGGPAFGAGSLTLRDWFAGMIIAGHVDHGANVDEIATWAYEQADAMIVARDAGDEDS